MSIIQKTSHLRFIQRSYGQRLSSTNHKTSAPKFNINRITKNTKTSCATGQSHHGTSMASWNACMNTRTNALEKSRKIAASRSLSKTGYHNNGITRKTLESSKSTFKTHARYKSTTTIKEQSKHVSSRRSSSASVSMSSASSTSSTRAHSSLKDALHVALLKPRSIPVPRWITPRPFSFTLSECFGHASFVLVAASYATDDFLLLRIIAVAGSTSMLFFTYFHPHGRVLWLPFKWNALFIVINTYRIGRSLYYMTIGEHLSQEMKDIKRDFFEVMDMTDFAKLTSIAAEETYDQGDLVIQQGNRNPYVRLVIEGELDAVRDGITTYSLEKGNFISEAGLHSGLLLDGAIESCCTIVANDNYKRTRCLKWKRSELVEMLKKENGLRRALKAALSWDIVRKLKGQRESITNHKVADAEIWTIKRKEQSEERYAAIVQNLLSIDRSTENMKKRTAELDHYRTIHHIDDEHHELALKRIGWTLEEYNAGKKHVPSEDKNDH